MASSLELKAANQIGRRKKNPARGVPLTQVAGIPVVLRSPEDPPGMELRDPRVSRPARLRVP